MLVRFAGLALVAAATAAAQERGHGPFGILGGPSLRSAQGLNPLGVHIGATFGRAPRPGLGARIDLAYTSYGSPVTIYDSWSPTYDGPLGAVSAGMTRLVSVTTNAVYVDRRTTSRNGDWTAGLGVYAVTESPEGRYMRPGWNVGFGWPVGSAAFLELRYHALIRPQSLRGLFPIAFGIRF